MLVLLTCPTRRHLPGSFVYLFLLPASPMQGETSEGRQRDPGRMLRLRMSFPRHCVVDAPRCDRVSSFRTLDIPAFFHVCPSSAI